MTRFDSVLVANRGEVACRIIRTARALGLRTVAIYSDADAAALHVEMADEAYNIGPAPAAESHLSITAILAAATASGAIHPGHGFLSKNATFARAVHDAGLVFVGPTPMAIEIMGDKARAKAHMLAAGVPCIPGYQGIDQSDRTLINEARKLGAPLMLKAAGGGNGMRRIPYLAMLPAALTLARAEALAAFGADTLILERAVQNARHVEIQIFADEFGHTIHLGGRDCSMQWPHQKVLEESPGSTITHTVRLRMGCDTMAAERSVNYVGAGTVEFLLDENGNDFYFLEMNTAAEGSLLPDARLTEISSDISAPTPLAIALNDELCGLIETGVGGPDITASGPNWTHRITRGSDIKVDGADLSRFRATHHSQPTTHQRRPYPYIGRS